MNNLSAKWASLGVAFYEEPIQSSPEEAIIDFLKSGEFPEDKKMIGIVLMWLKNYSNLIHVERLKKMSGDLNAFELAILGGIAKKVSSWGDSRWKAIEKSILTKNSKNVSFDIGDSQNFIKIKGLDEEFNSFGIRVAKITPDDDKKLMKREITIRSNLWLKNRVLFGSNVRSDVATLMEMGKIKNGYEAAKMAECSFTSAYRNFSALIEVGWPYFTLESK